MPKELALKNPLINEATIFSLGTIQTPYKASGFWGWAFSNMSVPMLRGVLIEYILVQHFIENIDYLVGHTVRTLTTWHPDKGDLEKSIRQHYASQPHGDVFDLQLTWGTTCEFKTTRAPKTWSISKTTYWNPLKDANCWTYGFPAQIYILAVLESEAKLTGNVLDLGALNFYIRTGRELDKSVGKRQSARFSDFSENQPVTCTFNDLIEKIAEIQKTRLTEILEKIEPGWKLDHSAYPNAYPLAVAFPDRVQAGFYEKDTKELIEVINVPWRTSTKPSWRDWEQVGFQYVHMLNEKKSG